MKLLIFAGSTRQNSFNRKLAAAAAALAREPPRWVQGKGIHLYHQPGFTSPSSEQAAATERNAQRFRDLCALSAEDLRARL